MILFKIPTVINFPLKLFYPNYLTRLFVPQKNYMYIIYVTFYFRIYNNLSLRFVVLEFWIVLKQLKKNLYKVSTRMIFLSETSTPENFYLTPKQKKK